jgi:hypothetical protein
MPMMGVLSLQSLNGYYLLLLLLLPLQARNWQNCVRARS